MKMQRHMFMFYWSALHFNPTFAQKSKAGEQNKALAISWHDSGYLFIKDWFLAETLNTVSEDRHLT